jgi:hypothetical protein
MIEQNSHHDIDRAMRRALGFRTSLDRLLILVSVWHDRSHFLHGLEADQLWEHAIWHHQRTRDPSVQLL